MVETTDTIAGTSARPQYWCSTRDVLAVLSTALFIAAYFAPWIWGLPHGSEQYIGQMQGAVIVQWAGIMSWYFGSSKDSSAKTATAAVQAETIASMATKGDGQ